MHIDGNNNIQVNGNLNLNVSGDLPVSKKTLRKLIRKELENILFKKSETKKVTYTKYLESLQPLTRDPYALVDESTPVGQKNDVLCIEMYTVQKSAIAAFFKNILLSLRTKKNNQNAALETMLQNLFDTEMIKKNIQRLTTCIFGKLLPKLY